MVSEPLGVVLVVGAWYSPAQLCLVPLVGAIAAGEDGQRSDLGGVARRRFVSVKAAARVGSVVLCFRRKLCPPQPVRTLLSHGGAPSPSRPLLPRQREWLLMLVPRGWRFHRWLETESRLKGGTCSCNKLCCSLLKECFHVILAGVTDLAEVVDLKFDHVFFTGND